MSLVTGGASGLGKATVERLVKNGGKVVILDIQGTRAKDVAQKLGDNVIVSTGCVSTYTQLFRVLYTQSANYCTITLFSILSI